MEENTNLEAVKEHFANLGEKLDRIIGHVGYRQLPDYVEDITLTNQYQGPVKLRGYRYLYMLVSADAITAMGSSNLMTLDIGGGVTYLQQLKPGWNVIDAPREFRYRVSGLTGNPPALLVHTNDLKAMDGVVSYAGGGVGGSAGNPSYTELTGSLVTYPYDAEWTEVFSNVVLAASAESSIYVLPLSLLGWQNVDFTFLASGTAISYTWFFNAQGYNDVNIGSAPGDFSESGNALRTVGRATPGPTSKSITTFGDVNSLTMSNANTTDSVTLSCYMRRWNG